MTSLSGLRLSLLLAQLLCAGLLAGAGPAEAQRRPMVTDEQIVREAQLAASGARIDLYQHGLVADAALLPAAERALARMEEVLGRKFDEATMGPRLRIYVAASTTVSHVWRGYQRPGDPRPYVFLNSRVASLAASGQNATYAHEIAHLLTWRYSSHTLREGFADYLALTVHPGAPVGPNPRGYVPPPSVPEEINDYLGTTRPAPQEATANPAYRQAYYFASYRLVKFLIDRKGLASFLDLYSARDPESRYAELYGASRRELALAAAR